MRTKKKFAHTTTRTLNTYVQCKLATTNTNSRMSSQYLLQPSSFLVVILLLLLALVSPLPPCAAASNGATDDGPDDAGRRARAAATVADLLTVHNDARRAVGVPPLTWSASIAGYAKRYAQSRRADCSPRRSPLFYFGENAAVGKGRHGVPTAALAREWVDEGRWYDRGSNSCRAAPEGGSCARYTQVVWRNTTQLGCARIVCDSGDTLLVCDYFPPGNYGTGGPY